MLLVQPDVVYIIECKLTQTLQAHHQLRDLYKPVVEAVYKRRVVLVQSCKNLRVGGGLGQVSCISQVFGVMEGSPAAAMSKIWTWHFMGNEPLGGWRHG